MSTVDPSAAESLMHMDQLLSLCQQVTPAHVDELTRAMTTTLNHGVPPQAVPACRQACVALVNGLATSGRLDACLSFIDHASKALPLPELAPMRAEIARHLASATLRQCSQSVLDQSQLFASGLLRPVLAEDHHLISDAALPASVAIVMQGPVLHDHQFTLETLKLYRRMFPTVDLVLSTWEGENLDPIEQAGIARLHILRNSKPELPGASNINFQVTSARNGVCFAVEQIRPDYVLKTRTDMRFYNPNLLLDMLALMDSFPMAVEGPQAQRLVIISDVVKYMMYAAPDKNMFGMAKDMWRYWDQPLDDSSAPRTPRDASMRAFSEASMAEVYLLRNYLSRIERGVKETLADHFDVLRDHFVVYDRSAADLYWPKYAHQLEYRFKHYAGNQLLEEFGFNDWMRLHAARCRPCDSNAIVDAVGAKTINHLIAGHSISQPSGQT